MKITEFPSGSCHVGNISEFKTEERVQAIITSPPYYAKRVYESVPDTWWGGDENCWEHSPCDEAPPPRRRSENDTKVKHFGDKTKTGRNWNAKKSSFCRCGAWYGQLGQEPSPHLFAEHLADLLASLPLADDGVMWVNIGDTYMSSPAGNRPKDGPNPYGDGTGGYRDGKKGIDVAGTGLKPKDLAGVPYRLAFAMQDRGYWWRDNIIWAKKNGLPESFKDRLQNRHETILMFTKSRRYYFDRYGIKVPLAQVSLDRYERPKKSSKYFEGGHLQNINKPQDKFESKLDYRSLWNVWNLSTAGHRSDVGMHYAPMPDEIAKRCVLLSTREGDVVLDPFAGTGTTAAMAHLSGRRFLAVDFDENLPKFLEERIGKQANIL